MVLWIALLLAGGVVIVVATTTLISASSARQQAVLAEQKYFAPTSAPLTSGPSPALAPSEPVSGSTSPPLVATPGQTAAHGVSTPSVVGSSTERSRPDRSGHPSAVVAPPSVPTSIELAGSRNPIRVVPIGVSAAGVLEPPSDISTAGWWVSGPRPGTPGRAVITGHIDSTAGLGAFAALDLLRSGDTIALDEADGRVLHFKVTARQQIEKTQLDPRLLQHTTNASDLLLVTCIGSFDYSTRSYDSNLLITAVPSPQ
jgi:hypothetical protein